MSPEETQDFLQDLTDRITQAQFCYAHEYEKGDLLIIDDRASLHKPGFDYAQPTSPAVPNACAWRPSARRSGRATGPRRNTESSARKHPGRCRESPAWSVPD